MKRFSVLLPLVLLACIISSSTAHAQFVNGKSYLGPHIGLGYVGSGLTFGADYETPITKPGEVGPGMIGIGGELDYTSWGSGDNSFGYTWTFFDIGVSGNYHFMLDNKKIDPFVGLILGYRAASFKWNDGTSTTSALTGYGGLNLGGSAGVRYFLSPNLALQARLGFGFYLLAVGVDFAF